MEEEWWRSDGRVVKEWWRNGGGRVVECGVVEW